MLSEAASPGVLTVQCRGYGLYKLVHMLALKSQARSEKADDTRWVRKER